jgi:hypothetical protein
MKRGDAYGAEKTTATLSIKRNAETDTREHYIY